VALPPYTRFREHIAGVSNQSRLDLLLLIDKVARKSAAWTNYDGSGQGRSAVPLMYVSEYNP